MRVPPWKACGRVAPDAAEVAAGHAHEGAGQAGERRFALDARVDLVDDEGVFFHGGGGAWSRAETLSIERAERLTRVKTRVSDTKRPCGLDGRHPMPDNAVSMFSEFLLRCVISGSIACALYFVFAGIMARYYNRKVAATSCGTTSSSA